MRGIRPLVALSVVVLAVSGACGKKAAPEAQAPASVRVTLDWAPAAPSRVEWTNDLGYRVTLDEGWLVSNTVELVRCPARQGLADDLRSLFAPREAWAGHTADPSTEPLRLRAPHAQSLTATAALDMGTLHPPPDEYCASFYLVARAVPGAAIAKSPSGVDLEERRLSVYLRGSFLRPSSGPSAAAAERVPFTAETGSAYGKSAIGSGVVDTTPSAPSLHVAAGASLALRVVRDTARLFDKIDFAASTPETIARQVMANLVDSTRVSLGDR
jgi:hypothetical protein